MPKATTNKKKPTSKVGGGGVNTKKSKLNLKLVIPVVLIVAALGGFYIFRKSGASGNYPWVYGPGNWNISGGEYINKGAGKDYRLLTVGSNSVAHVTITPAQLANSRKICVHYIGANGRARLDISGGVANESPASVYPRSSGNLCLDEYTVLKMKENAKRWNETSIHIMIDAAGANGESVTFDNVYGTW